MSGLPASSRRFLPGRPFDPPRAVMTPRTFTLRDVFPLDQLISRDRARSSLPDHVLQLPRGNSCAGTLHPHVVLADRRARGDVANRHDAVERHVANVLLAGLNL